MRQLLNTLFVTQEDMYLSLDGDNVVLLQNEKRVARLPLHNIESIITFGYTGASPALMGYCAERNISIVFLTRTGRFIARVIGEIRGNVLLRKRSEEHTSELQSRGHLVCRLLREYNQQE